MAERLNEISKSFNIIKKGVIVEEEEREEGDVEAEIRRRVEDELRKRLMKK
jgi:hypothetical protein